MKAVGYNSPGPIDRADALVDLTQDVPEARGHDLLVKVLAISVNPVDYKIRMSRAADDGIPVVLGWDAVGEAVSAGEKASGFQPGDRVWYAGSINRPGTNSEYHLVDARIVSKAPASVSPSDAAALPLTALTAYEMLWDRLKVDVPVPGAAEAAVIIGGAGGVGSITIQLLRALTSLTVIATASRPETKAWVKQLGAHHVIDHSKPLAPQVEELDVGAPGFVFSTNESASYAQDAADMIAPQGRFGLIDDPEHFDIMPFKAKSVSIHWELMFTRSLFQTTDMKRQSDILQHVAELLDAGQIRSTTTESLGNISAGNLIKAHQMLESGKARGKIVLDGF
ncbi:zinc-binding alcohol dehydrogenase family protein [Roseibium hamelinense]|uniref:Zinc-type alcohol dehydrogenase-like protein n=1 Tax=Roseibium hamelinense TaxID=150831 RepID=A0A562TG54_9HYPH|nr:zinc-binding alcohol dehydrogenase family protein [Roseibium hamelinense]MTI43121.1 zinc-binding alcohol dehydrogenase family protein [Roseibium hamelinense]TWI92532.1 zinc-binding alcohol dehydrogenase family protein [Roseibium hamelinense]